MKLPNTVLSLSSKADPQKVKKPSKQKKCSSPSPAIENISHNVNLDILPETVKNKPIHPFFDSKSLKQSPVKRTEEKHSEESTKALLPVHPFFKKKADKSESAAEDEVEVNSKIAAQVFNNFFKTNDTASRNTQQRELCVLTLIYALTNQKDCCITLFFCY